MDIAPLDDTHNFFSFVRALYLLRYAASHMREDKINGTKGIVDVEIIFRRHE